MNVRKKDYPDAPDVGDMAHGWRARDHPVTGRKHVNRAKQMLQNVQGKRKDEKTTYTIMLNILVDNIPALCRTGKRLQ